MNRIDTTKFIVVKFFSKTWSLTSHKLKDLWVLRSVLQNLRDGLKLHPVLGIYYEKIVYPYINEERRKYKEAYPNVIFYSSLGARRKRSFSESNQDIIVYDTFFKDKKKRNIF